MAFPTTTILDSFGGTLGGWTQSSYGNGALAIVTGSCTSAIAGFGAAEWNAGVVGPDCEAYLTISAVGNATDDLYIHARESNNGTLWNGYSLRWQPNAGAWFLYRITAGAPAATINSGTQALAVGDKIGIECVGTTITAYRKPAAGAWGSVGGGVDATYGAAGFLGLEIFDTLTKIDDFAGGTIVTGGGGAPTPNRMTLLGV